MDKSFRRQKLKCFGKTYDDIAKTHVKHISIPLNKGQLIQIYTNVEYIFKDWVAIRAKLSKGINGSEVYPLYGNNLGEILYLTVGVKVFLFGVDLKGLKNFQAQCINRNSRRNVQQYFSKPIQVIKKVNAVIKIPKYSTQL